MEHLKYPYGKFEYGKIYSEKETRAHAEAIRDFPQQLKQTVGKLSDAQLTLSYREGGWTAEQIIHHLADSHMNALIRVKLALTEENPVIKPYDQDKWALLPDNELDPAVSISLIDGIHARWSAVLDKMSGNDMDKTYFNPEYQRSFSLREFMALYAWHGKQHLGHLKIISGEAL